MTTRLWGADRLALGHEMADDYNAGATVRAICAKYGRSYGSVHDLLALAGVTFRPRGNPRKPRTTKGARP
jgi:hypothetical protein